MQHGLPTAARVGSPSSDAARLADLAARIGAVDPDVLLLQEVDHNQRRSGRVPQWQALARELRMPYTRFAPFYYGPTTGIHLPARRAVCGRDRGGSPMVIAAAPAAWMVAPTGCLRLPAFGVATLSRHPITTWEAIELGNPIPFVERRAAARGLAAFRVLDNNRSALLTSVDNLLVVNTHLVSTTPEARAQLDTLLAELALRRGPVLLGGDLNLDPQQLPPAVRPLAGGPTFPAARPRRQLDHLLAVGDRWATADTRAAWSHAPAGVRPSRPVPARDGGVVETGYSDHRLLWADV